MTTGRRALGCALAPIFATASWMLAAASPASAYVCAFGIDTPGPASISGSPTVRFTGPFVAKHGLADRAIEVTFTQAPGPAPPGMVRTGAAVGPTNRYDVPVGPLTFNGRYTARIRATHPGTVPVLDCDDQVGTGGRRDTEQTRDVSFGVSVRANPPRNVRASFDAGTRRATVTWERSSDPDIAGYTITKKVGSAAPSARDVPAESLSWTDADLPAGEAVVTYAVEAARRGPDPGTIAEKSAQVVAGALSLPGAPARTTSTTTGGPPSSGSGVPTTVPFSLGRSVPGEPPRPGADPFDPLGDSHQPGGADPGTGGGDGGYQPVFPYPPPGQGDASQLDGHDDRALVGRAGSSEEGGDGPPQLAYVASALLSTVVAAHVLWLRRRIDEAPEPDGAAPHLEAVPADRAPPAEVAGTGGFAPPAGTADAASDDGSVENVPRDDRQAEVAAAAAAPARRRPLRAARVGAAAAGGGAGASLRPPRRSRETSGPAEAPATDGWQGEAAPIEGGEAALAEAAPARRRTTAAPRAAPAGDREAILPPSGGRRRTPTPADLPAAEEAPGADVLSEHHEGEAGEPARVRRRPGRAAGSPALTAGGVILRPARDGSGTFEPVPARSSRAWPDTTAGPVPVDDLEPPPERPRRRPRPAARTPAEHGEAGDLEPPPGPPRRRPRPAARTPAEHGEAGDVAAEPAAGGGSLAPAEQPPSEATPATDLPRAAVPAEPGAGATAARSDAAGRRRRAGRRRLESAVVGEPEARTELLPSSGPQQRGAAADAVGPSGSAAAPAPSDRPPRGAASEDPETEAETETETELGGPEAPVDLAAAPTADAAAEGLDPGGDGNRSGPPAPATAVESPTDGTGQEADGAPSGPDALLHPPVAARAAVAPAEPPDGAAAPEQLPSGAGEPGTPSARAASPTPASTPPPPPSRSRLRSRFNPGGGSAPGTADRPVADGEVVDLPLPAGPSGTAAAAEPGATATKARLRRLDRPVLILRPRKPGPQPGGARPS